MGTEQSSGSSGIGLSAVFLVFLIILKLTGVISWSWWWVTAPLWGSVAFALVFIVLPALVVLWQER